MALRLNVTRPNDADDVQLAIEELPRVVRGDRVPGELHQRTHGKLRRTVKRIHVRHGVARVRVLVKCALRELRTALNHRTARRNG